MVPSLVTPQVRITPSAAPGSVAVPVRLMSVPSGDVAGAPAMLGVGATLVTAMVLVVVVVSVPSKTDKVTT